MKGWSKVISLYNLARLRDPGFEELAPHCIFVQHCPSQNVFPYNLHRQPLGSRRWPDIQSPSPPLSPYYSLVPALCALSSGPTEGWAQAAANTPRAHRGGAPWPGGLGVLFLFCRLGSY